MNKTYKLVWNSYRNAWIVAHEGSRGRGKSGGRVKAVCGAVAAALMSLAAVSASGQVSDQPPTATSVAISGAPTTGVTLDGSYSYTDGSGESGQNTSDSGTSYNWFLSTDDALGSDTTLSGSFTGGAVTHYTVKDADDGNYLFYCVKPVASTSGYVLPIVQSGSGTFANAYVSPTVNSGLGSFAIANTITGAQSCSAALQVRVRPCNAAANGTTAITAAETATCRLNLTGEGVSVSTGSILVSAANDSVVAGVNVTTGAGAIANSGTISSVNSYTGTLSGHTGTFSGVARGIQISAGNSLHDIANSGSISGRSTGTNSGTLSGIISGGIVIDGGAVTNGITNSSTGSISGISGSITGTLSGGLFSDLSTISGYIDGVGIAVLNAGSVAGGITNHGIITGAFDLSGDPNIAGALGAGIYNSGTIQGGITNDGFIVGLGFGIYARNASITDGIAANGTPSDQLEYSTSGILGLVNGIYIASSSVSGDITNSSLIFGAANNGLELSGSSVAGGINNSGFIMGLGKNGLEVSGSSVTGRIVNSNSGGIGGGVIGILIGDGSIVDGGITNSGTITGGSSYGIEIDGSVSGMVNSGTIQGNSTGLYMGSGGAITGGVTNSGTIQGGYYAIYAEGTLGTLSISGLSARLLGDVYASETEVTIIGGATFGNDNVFDVKTFTVAEGATFNMGVGTATGSTYKLPEITIGSAPSGDDGKKAATRHGRAGNRFACNFIEPEITGVSAPLDGNAKAMKAVAQHGHARNGFASCSPESGISVSGGVTNSGTISVDAGLSPVIKGDYTQTGLFKTNVASCAPDYVEPLAIGVAAQTGRAKPKSNGHFACLGTTFGKVTITGAAALSDATFEVVAGDSCSSLSAGQTIAGIISSGSLTGTFSSTVTDDCADLTFTAVKNGNAIDLVISGGSVSGSCGIATTLPVSSAPTVDLCSEGATASGMTGSGPWTWNCGEASCTAPLYTVPVTYYTPPPSSVTDLHTGGDNAAPPTGATINVIDNGKEGTGIDLPPPPTTPPTGTPGTPGSSGTPPPTGINIILPGTGTVNVSSDSSGTKLGVQGVTMPGETKEVSTVMVTQGSASFTATKEGQPVASLKNGIFVVSGDAHSHVTVDATGHDTKIGVTSSDTIVVPTGSTGVSGTSVDLPPPTASGGAASTINVKIGDQNLSVQSSQSDTKMTFKVVDIGGVQTPVLEVTGSAVVSGNGDNQPIVSIAGNVIKTGKSGGSSQVCNTIVQASSNTSSDVVHVVTCYIVLEPGSFSAMSGGNGFAAIKDGIVWAGETAEFDKNGKVTAAYLGTRSGNTDAVGDDMVPGGAKFAAVNYHVGAFIPRLSGTPLRLNGAKLDERIFAVVSHALGVAVQPALPLQSDQGVLNFTFNGNLTGQGVQNTQVNYTINTDTASVIPSKRIYVDTSRADGVSISAEGDVSVATGGLVTTFTPSVADPKAFAEKINQLLPGSTVILRWNGSWQVTAADSSAYVGRPQWSFWPAEPGAATFSTTPDGNLLYSDNGRAQPLFPDFYDYDTLQAIFRTELKDPALTVLPRMDGTATATVNGKTYTLAPQWNLIKPAAGKPAWWIENGVVYIKNADGSAQGFMVK